MVGGRRLTIDEEIVAMVLPEHPDLSVLVPDGSAIEEENGFSNE